MRTKRTDVSILFCAKITAQRKERNSLAYTHSYTAVEKRRLS